MDQGRLKECVTYNSRTGIFHWKHRVDQRPQWNGRYAGKQAGHPNKDGYIEIALDGTVYYGHRVAWFYVYGVWPKRGLDHRDQSKAHNWISNLREGTKSQNAINAKVRSDSTTGMTGIAWYTRDECWRAYVSKDGKQHHIGYFRTKAAAQRARNRRARELFGEFAEAA